MPRQLLWFMLVGALSTVLQTIVYVSARELFTATWASWLALLVVTPANTEAHRRITFNVTTTAVGRLHWEAGLTSVVVYLANLLISPAFATLAGPHPSALTESLILALTGSLIGGARYVILRSWVFSARRHRPAATAPDATAPAGLGAGVLVGAAVSGAPAVPPVPGRLATVRRNSLRRRQWPSRPNAVPAAAETAASYPVRPGHDGLTGALPLAALACLGTLAPIPTARLCAGQPNAGVLNQRPPGRLRAWHRNRRRHLSPRG